MDTVSRRKFGEHFGWVKYVNYSQPLYSLGHQSTYSDIGSSTADALSAHNASSLFLSTWHLLIALLLIVWGALYISGRQNRATDMKPRRSPDQNSNDDGGVGGLN
jgi:hypothetical protein